MSFRNPSVFGICGNLLLVLLVYGIYEKIRHSHSVHRGFFCDDQTLKYPYIEEYVSWRVVKLWGYIVPAIIILIGDAFVPIHPHKTFLQRLLNAGNVYLVFLFGMYSTQLIYEWIKKNVARPRPHFFDVCQPVYDEKACFRGEYIWDFTCAGNAELFSDMAERLDKVEEVQESFVSGHTTFSFSIATFLLIYLNSRLMWKRVPASNLALMLVQIGIICTALFFSITRLVDHHHHASDIVAGSVIGTLIQLYVAYMSNAYLAPNYDEIFEEEQTPLIRSQPPSYSSLP
ncbi:hypothetical protein TCAL_10993 [Tigriopus californicus]|uniref:Phosphatidic acid phosphatase type 2/haloperoxidase domain-containing protein n=1 Tax=Tigriopus californicus TaxID=6832 RepID=A0A553NBE9_TIGCA|nr:phospholipid phosphatase 1-like [Tigriopus californicus]TRY62760.1 hypothetical protein TCAL_10993 [Tigriopus californicus]|eukprot:TCALIF_10993-PA protein Name:"Similar to wun Putative phosphatidate phosphatase (Drosophila melanogaster)" AED:0.34 eAED:0.34 QI:0/-1/0/1/-1/1/1/0/286